MQNWRKLLSVVLAFLMVANIFAGLGMVSGQAQSTAGSATATDFTETFSGTMSSGWENVNYGHVYGGLYHADRYLVNRYFGAQNTKNYYVQADVTFNRYFNGEAYHTGFTGIGARYDTAANSGYELAVGASAEEDKLVFRFAKRVDGELVESEILQSVGTVGDTVTLRLAVYGSVILCYANGVMVYETEDTDFAEGVPAITNGDAQGVYDNFIYNTFAPDGYDHTKAVAFSGDLDRAFANSANWDPAFTFNATLRLEKSLKINEDLFGNEIEVDDSFWETGVTTPSTNTGVPVFGNVLNGQAAAYAGVYIRGDLRMVFGLHTGKDVTLAIYKGQEQLYSNNAMGSNKDFAVEITSTADSVAFAVDGTILYTADATGLTGATGVEATNAVGRIFDISFTTGDILKKITSAENLVIQTGTPKQDLNLNVTVTTLQGVTYTAAPQEVNGFNNTPGDYALQLKYEDLAFVTNLHVRDDASKIVYEDFNENNLTDNGWHAGATAENFSNGAYVFGNSDAKYVTKSAGWVNAYVQADISLSGKHASSTINSPYAGIVARRNDSANSGIEFALVYNQSYEKLRARLYLRDSDALEYSTSVVYEPGKVYTLRLEVCGAQIKAYIDGELVFDLGGQEVDLTAAGMVGICNIGGTATADNFSAAVVEEGYFGAEPTITDTAVTEFIDVVSASSHADVTVDAAKTLVNQYAKLTAEQKAMLPSYIAFKYQYMLVRAERNAYSKYSGVAQSELLFYDDYSDASQWNSVANMSIEDGKMSYAMDTVKIPSDKLVNCQIALHQRNSIQGVVSYASAEFTLHEVDSAKGGFVGIMLSYSTKGNYHARVSTKYKRLELYRSVDGGSYSDKGGFLESKSLGDYASLITMGKTFKLSCVVTDTQILVYLNDGKDSTGNTQDQLMLTYTFKDDVDKAITSAENTAGVRLLNSRVQVDNFMILGSRSDRTDTDGVIAAYTEAAGTYVQGNYYSDTFEDEVATQYPSHWLQNVNVDNWLVKDENQLRRKVLYSQDYSSYAEGVTVNGWSGTENKTAMVDGNMAYHAVQDSKYTVAGLSGYRNYTIEAKVMFDTYTTINNNKTAIAAIEGNGYAFALQVNPTTGTGQGARLYDHNGAGKMLGSTYFSYDMNVYHTLRMEFKDGIITCYVDDVWYFRIEDPGTGKAGAVGVRTSAYAMYADDFTVTVENDATTGEQMYVYDAVNPQHTISWLHVFDPSPIISADIKVDAPDANARVGVMTRYAVENSYVKAGYDFAEQKWFISYTPGANFETKTVYANSTATFTPDTWYRVDLVSTGTKSYLSVNGKLMVVTDTSYVGFGRIGLFAENTRAAFDNVYSYSPMGETYSTGVTEQQLYHSGNCSEIEQMDDGTIYASSSTSTWFTSPAVDAGRSFTSMSNPLPAGATILEYISTIKLKNADGTTAGYLSVSTDFTASFSTDFKTWEQRGYIIPKDDKSRTDESIGMTPSNIGTCTLIHISSFTQVTLLDGTIRVFLPIAFRYFEDNDPQPGREPTGHCTRVFYSDDFGKTWSESQNDTRKLTDGTTVGASHSSSFCEGKIIRCDDGTLRMYCSRKWAPCIYYVESKDNGVTWSSWGTIESMPCAVSSYGISEDPLNPGTYYMAYVKNVPYTPTGFLPRNLLMLVKTTNGKDWEEVMVLDRYTSTKHPLSDELYQFLDPNVLVTKDYIYVGYGRSDTYEDHTHNHQTTRFIRIDRGYSVTVDSDMQDVLSVNTNRGLSGDTITVTVTQPADAQIKAGTLKVYSTDRATSTKIIDQPDHVTPGTGLGNVFVFTMPAADVVIDAELLEDLSTAQTNFSLAILGAGYKAKAKNENDGLRYLSRMYLPQNGRGKLLLDVTYQGTDYTIVGFGSLYAKTSDLGSTTLDMAAVQSGVAKVSQAYPSGNLYDLNASYVDFTVRLLGSIEKLSEPYSVRTYVQLKDASGNTVYAYSDDTISRSALDFQ